MHFSLDKWRKMEQYSYAMEEKGSRSLGSQKKLVSLRGGFMHKIGDNGRMVLPSNFREALLNRGVIRLIIIRDLDCLRVWPEDEWEKREDGFKDLNLDDSRVSGYLRYLYANLSDLEIDGQGRFVISEQLKKDMGFKGQAYLLGMGNLFEIWNPEAYQWKSKELEQGFSGNRNYVAEMLEKRKRDEGK